MWIERQSSVHRFIGFSLATAFVSGAMLGRCTQASDDPARLETTVQVDRNGSQSAWKRIIGPIEFGPVGWKRTPDGWETAEHWEVSNPSSNAAQINRVIQGQRFQENGTMLSWCIAMVLSFVRRIDPVTLIAAEVCLLGSLIALILHRRDLRSRASLLIEKSK